MSPNKLNIKWIYPFALLSLFLLSCSECEEVPYVDLNPIYRCPNYYAFTNLKNSVIDIISSDEDIDRYASQSIADYISYRTANYSNEYDESNMNRMIAELAECIREYHVDFSKYSVAAIATPSIVDASTSTKEVCSDEINIYMIMADPMNLYIHSYNSYLQVPKGDYKLNIEKVRPPTGTY